MPGVNPSSGKTEGLQNPHPRETDSSRSLVGAWIAALAAAFALPVVASAQDLSERSASVFRMSLGTSEVMQLSIFAGVMGAALLSAIWLIRERARIAAENVELRTRVAELGESLRRSDSLINLRDQRLIVWANEGGAPSILGELPASVGAPIDRSAFLAFGRWLSPGSASALERAASTLRDHGTGFDLVVETRSGSLLEVMGRKTAFHAAIRFLSLSDVQKEHARLKLEHQRLLGDNESLLALADALEMPIWLRDKTGGLAWVNHAYARAVDSGREADVHRENKELLPTAAREDIARGHLARPVYSGPVSTVVGGERRIYTVTEASSSQGSAGIAADISEIDDLRRELERTMLSHAATLDQLTTAVAIFDAGEKLRFYNQAFQKLWDLDTAFLDSAPENAIVLDRLRSEGKLEEQPEWRRWKEALLGAYRSPEPQEHWWHLPDGRTIRVIANPQPNGGVTWVFENLTEKFDLESRYNTAMRVQGETLDNLAEGVAVFGPDGRLRLSNPAFRTLWGLPAELVSGDSHIAAIRAACDAVAKESPWGDFVAAVTGFDDERRNGQGQTELLGGTILSYAFIHLPNGQVMMTFVDVTDSANVERALMEKNEALQKAGQLKNDFVQHVSYELRSPLTNIIGFTELLGLPDTGPLTKRQREYVDHIGSSSSVLLTIVNDILDLATVDAGIMQLDIAEVRIGAAVQAAADLVAERLREHDIKLLVEMDDASASFLADENRLRQILFNLLSNAANYAPEHGTITLTAHRGDGTVEFRVHDDGPGMSADVLETIFKRFEPRANGGRRRGAGLGLSIVKSFVELHGGTVEIETDTGRGTMVICRFPVSPSGMRVAAE